MDRRLARWVKAGLIGPDQAERIAAFEADGRRPLFLYPVAGLAGLAIAIGLVSIVASNWDAIPGRVKIAIDLTLVVALGSGVVRLEQRGPRWVSEAAILVLYGLVLASIALIGQVYQLGGDVPEALATWSVLTAILMTRGRTKVSAASWVAGLQVSYAAVVSELVDRVRAWETLFVSTLYWVPVLAIVASRAERLRRARPALAGVLAAVGWCEVMVCATIGTFAFYDDLRGESWGPMLAGAAVSAVLTALAIRGLPDDEARLPRALLLGACWLLAHGPWPVSPGDLELLAALTFIALWLGAAFAAHRGRQAGLLNAATAIIGVRIIAIYFEVFGSLLDTGLGLVLAGLLTLGLVWLWARKRREFESELARGSGR
jgi:uncharacterized membrane protein